MTREEAEASCARLSAEDPDRETHRFVPRRNEDGTWSVAKIGLPPVGDPGGTETRADEKPATGDDPRTSLDRNVGGPWGIV